MSSIEGFPPTRRPLLTLLTGFLGSGKTTLLRRYLDTADATDIAIIVNEYGTTPIDGDLITFARDSTAVRTTTGCLCCTISGDVKDALLDLAVSVKAGIIPPFRHLVIETTGMADPMSLAHAVITDADISERYEFNQTVTLVDAIHGEHWLERHRECRQQIALADQLVLTKTDLISDPVSKRELGEFISVLRNVNPIAKITDIETFSPLSLTEGNRTLARHSVEPSVSHGKHDDHHHHHGVNSFTLTFEDTLSRDLLEARLTALGEKFGRDLLRVKGVVRLNGSSELRTVLVQGVGGIMQLTDHDQSVRVDKSELVFITNALSAATAETCLLGRPDERTQRLPSIRSMT